MSQTPNTAVAVIRIDIGKNSFHVVGHDARGAIVLRQKWSRGQVEARLANLPPCLIGMEACVGAHQNLLQRAAGPYMWVIVDRIGLSPHVRFTPDSDGRGDIPVRQLRAISGSRCRVTRLFRQRTPDPTAAQFRWPLRF
jgi:hypothetical protein